MILWCKQTNEQTKHSNKDIWNEYGRRWLIDLRKKKLQKTRNDKRQQLQQEKMINCGKTEIRCKGD